MYTTVSRRGRLGATGLVAAAALLMTFATAKPVRGDAHNPGVLPVGSNPVGQSYAEWAADWWRWAYSLPLDGHPLSDETGEDCAAGQAGHVWFLGGTLTTTEEGGVVIGEAERTCHVPRGTFLFFPILNVLQNNIGEDPPLTDAELEADAAFLSTGIADVSATVDGTPVNGLDDFLILGDAFGFDFVGDGPAETPEGGSSRGANAGVYLMLAPLSVGEHTIDFDGSFVFTAEEHGFDFVFVLDIHYNIVVVPRRVNATEAT